MTGPHKTHLSRLLTRSFRADREAPGRARSSLAAVGDHIDDEIAEDMRLLVSELVTNSLRHTGTSTIRLEVWGSDAIVQVQVSDDGTGFDPPDTPRPRAASGWGLFMVERLADRWGVETRGDTRVWFEFLRPGAGGRSEREFFARSPTR